MSRFGCVCYDPQTGKLHDANNPPDYADLKADLGWLLDPGRIRATNQLEGAIGGMYHRLLMTFLPKLLVILFVVSAIVAAIVTAFVYLIRWVISLFAAAV
jgi:hypothetical protein